MDDKDNDDNTYQRGQTITILKPRLSLGPCKGDRLQLKEYNLRQKKRWPKRINV